MQMIKYPSIEQFRNIIKQVRLNAEYQGKDEDGNAIYDKNVTYPVIKFIGSCKAHGTNGSIVLNSENEYYAESRNRILSLEADNAGFFLFVMKNEGFFKNILKTYLVGDVKAVSLSGEWAGGNIQSGVAINGLPKMFLVFGLKLIYENESDDSTWVSRNDLNKFHNPEINTYFIDTFQTWEIDIDFNEPEYSQNRIVQWVQEVENECPIGKYFDVSGIGEGIVFQSSDGNFKFKAKGDKHQNSKVTVIASIDTDQIESVKEFVEYAVTENRLQQGITVMTENNIQPDNKSIGHFIKWVVSDVMKEESDTIIENELDQKILTKQIQQKAKNWFINKYF